MTSDRLGRLGVSQVSQLGGDSGGGAGPAAGPAESQLRAECVAGSWDPHVLRGAGICLASGFSVRASGGDNQDTRGRADGMQSPCHLAEPWRQLHVGSGDPCPSLVPNRPGPGRGSFAPWVELQLATYLPPWDGSPPRPALGTLVRGDLGQKRPDG